MSKKVYFDSARGINVTAENEAWAHHYEAKGFKQVESVEAKIERLEGQADGGEQVEALKAENLKLIEENIALKAELEAHKANAIEPEAEEEKPKPKKKKASKK